MKQVKLIMLLMLLHGLSIAQKTGSAQDSTAREASWQFGVFGGISLPMGDYKTLPDKAKPGFTGGLFIDKYFRGNRVGFGVDARYVQHGLSKFDTVHFINGSIYRSPVDVSHFSYYVFTVGPTYKIINSSPSIELEAYLRAGITLQHFPEYQKTMATDSGQLHQTFALGQAFSNNNQPSWAVIGGLRLTGKLSSSLGLFLQADYLQTFGKLWGSVNNRFTYDDQTQLKPVTSNSSIINPFTSGYYTSTAGFANTQSVNVQAVNITIGLKYILFQHKPATKPVLAPVVIVPPPVPTIVKKDIQVIAKDKLTRQVIDGVAVSVTHDSITYNSVTNSRGEAERIKNVLAGNYMINGSRNDLQAGPARISAEDFKNTAGPVIFKEIYIMDSLFILKGVTMACESGNPIPHVAIALRNTKTNTVISLHSDSAGQFTYSLAPNSDYTVVANQKGKFSQTELLSTTGLDRNVIMFVTLNLKLCDIAKDKVFELKNILYDFNKADIRPDAALMLDNLVTILQQNPSMFIELSSHTDSRGRDAYNLKLSDRRAKSAVAYLISKGIDQKRLVARGYGETRLVNRCANGVSCTEEEHQQNRRTEIKVLKY